MSASPFPPRLADVTREMVVDQRSLDYIKYLSCLVITKNATQMASDVFATRYIDHAADFGFLPSQNLNLVVKAATAAGTTTDATWAGPIAPVNPLADAFLAFVRPLTILGKLPALRRVPPNMSVPMQTGGGTYQWLGQNAPTPLSAMAFATTTLGIAKCSGLVVITDELARVSSPDAAVVVRNDLAAGIAAFTDVEFINPARAPVAGVSPGSITNGVTPIAPSGTTSAALKADVGALIAQVLANNPDPSSIALVMRPQEAIMLAGATNSQTLTVAGGTYAGLPVVVSTNAGTTIVALNQSAILFADGGIDVTTSKQATIQFDSAPDNPPVAATVAVPLWPNNLIGFKAVREIIWKKATATAVSLVSPTAYVPGT